MISLRHPRTTRYLGAPPDWRPDEHGSCTHLSIADIDTTAGPAMQSIFEPTPQELADLVAGGRIVLTVVGRIHPPIQLSTWLPPNAARSVLDGVPIP